MQAFDRMCWIIQMQMQRLKQMIRVHWNFVNQPLQYVTQKCSLVQVSCSPTNISQSQKTKASKEVHPKNFTRSFQNQHGCSYPSMKQQMLYDLHHTIYSGIYNTTICPYFLKFEISKHISNLIIRTKVIIIKT